MNLIDKIHEDSREGHTAFLFEGTRKVVIHRDVFNAACDLVATSAERMPAVAKYTCWPDYNTWIETQKDDDNRRFGFLFYGNLKGGQSVTYGYGMIFLEYEDGLILEVPVRYDLERYELKWDPPFKSEADLIKMLHKLKPEDRQPTIERFRESMSDPIAAQAKYNPVLREIKPLLIAILAFMNSPKLITSREADLTRFNSRRIKRGKFPYHPHHEIRLNIDKHRLNVSPATGAGSERGQYFVRAHLRFLVHPRYKNVSVTLVEPHFRGNPELGIRNTSYAVERQNSVWSE